MINHEHKHSLTIFFLLLFVAFGDFWGNSKACWDTRYTKNEGKIVFFSLSLSVLHRILTPIFKLNSFGNSS